MTSVPYMPLYVGDYIRDTMRLSTLEHGAYMLLIMDYWSNGSLPKDDRKLARIARVSESEWSKMRDSLADLFTLGEWRHKRVEFELEKATGKSAIARESAKVRWKDHAPSKPPRRSKRNANAYANADADGHAGAMPADCGRITNAYADGMPRAPASLSEPYSGSERGGSQDPSSVFKDENGRQAPLDVGYRDPDAELYRRGKEVLGPKAGGLITKLKNLYNGSVPKTRAVIETASLKGDATEYIAGVLRAQPLGSPQLPYDKGI